MNSLQLLAIGLYLALVAATVAFLHLKYYQQWKRHELARRTIGIAAVLGLAIPLAFFGIVDWVSLAIVIGGFGVAGAITGFFHTQEAAEKEREAEKIKGGMRGGGEARGQDAGAI